MTLSETMLAAWLFLACFAGSLQLWGVTAGAAVAEERRQLLRERVEAELMASEGRLRLRSQGWLAAGDCAAQGRALQAALAEHPVPEGLSRRVVGLDDGLVRVSVDAAGLEEPRQRLWSPAAFGLCVAATAPSVPGDPE